MAESTNKVALVVGAGDYIGKEIAIRFAEEGYFVCLARRNADKLSTVIDEITDNGGQAKGFAMDARSEESVQTVFAEIEHNIGPLEVVIFNVGANVQHAIQDTSTKLFSKVWEMACLAGFLTGREAAKYMQPRKSGSIFFTGATASLKANSGYAAFASAKFGLRAVAQSMARELGPDNIHVAHLVIDAAVDTKWVRELMVSRGVEPETLPQGAFMNPKSVAQSYWQLHQQPQDAWTFELDLRPFAETW